MSGLEAVIVSLAMAALTFDHRHPFASKSYRVETMADYQQPKRTDFVEQEEEDELSRVDYYGDGIVSDRRSRYCPIRSRDMDDEGDEASEYYY
jgi:hypothetical protein